MGLFANAMLFCTSSLGSQLTTNEIDMAFSEKGRRHRIEVFSGVDQMAAKLINSRKPPEVLQLERYFLHRLVGFQVSTNMTLAPAMLRCKKDALMDYAVELPGFFNEDDAELLLGHAASVVVCPTNHLAQLREEAWSRDVALGHARQRPFERTASTGGHGPNVTAFIQYRRALRSWNEIVPVYRQTVVDIVTQQLDRVWIDLPQAERQSKIAQKLRSHGLWKAD